MLLGDWLQEVATLLFEAQAGCVLVLWGSLLNVAFFWGLASDISYLL